MIVTHTLLPEVSAEADTLILGSIPSPKSRETGFYYGHPQNRFWLVLAEVFGEDTPNEISEKQAFLARHHIALWDVVAQCDIRGASDASIRNPIPNDIAGLLSQYPRICRIFTTGNKAHMLYGKLCYPNTGISDVCLPSTSPANCRMSLEMLVTAYSVIAQRMENVND